VLSADLTLKRYKRGTCHKKILFFYRSTSLWDCLHRCVRTRMRVTFERIRQKGGFI